MSIYRDHLILIESKKAFSAQNEYYLVLIDTSNPVPAGSQKSLRLKNLGLFCFRFNTDCKNLKMSVNEYYLVLILLNANLIRPATSFSIEMKGFSAKAIIHPSRSSIKSDFTFLEIIQAKFPAYHCLVIKPL